ncbi:MAG: hypothetical protein WAW52_01190 [Methanothrix sp.]
MMTGKKKANLGKPKPKAKTQPEKTATKNTRKPAFKIDPEFKNLLPPLDKGAIDQLKEKLQREGCRDKLVACRIDGDLTLLDGYRRNEICEELGIKFEVEEIEISSRVEAKIWIIRNQRGKRNLTDSQLAMVAVELEALYGQWAKEKENLRKAGREPKSTFLNLEKSGPIHAAEMAAKDMGVSPQTVSSAKKVVKDGIPELKNLVVSGDVAVGAAVKVASYPVKVQEKIVEKAVAQIQEGKKPKIAAIIREIEPKAMKNDPNKLLETFRKNQEANLRLLDGIKETQRPENLVEMLSASEKMATRLKEIEAKSLDPEIGSQAYCVIELRHFMTFIESIVPISEKATLCFDSDGIKVKAADLFANIVQEAFLPRSVFSRYEELGMIRLSDTSRLLRMMSIHLSRYNLAGKKNVLIYVEPDNGEKIFGRLHCVSGQHRVEHKLENPLPIEDITFPEMASTCKVHLDGKDLVNALKSSLIMMSETGNFLVSEKFFRIVFSDKPLGKDADTIVAKPHCEVFGDGTADSTFAVDKLLEIKPTIAKCKDVKLSLGMNQPMIMDLAIDEMTIRYHVKEKVVEKAKKKRAHSSS